MAFDFKKVPGTKDGKKGGEALPKTPPPHK